VAVNPLLVNLMGWCEAELERLQAQLSALKAGKFRIGENCGQGWVDTTSQSIERVEANIAELDRILAEYRAGPTQRP
jgi:hypothetical protein